MNTKRLYKIINGTIMAASAFMLGSLVEKIKITEEKKNLDRREEVLNVKYSFCRCIAENMKECGYQINFMPKHDLDVKPAVEHEYAYSVAIAAIGDSDMDPYHKEQCILGLRKEENIDYYKGIIAIADNNNMRSTDKMQTILNL